MPNAIDTTALAQTWVHSHEEDTPTQMVYRPASYSFPPSRGRRSFELAEDGTLIDHGIGPDDRPSSEGGSWRLQGLNKLELSTTESNIPKEVMQVVAVNS